MTTITDRSWPITEPGLLGCYRLSPWYYSITKPSASFTATDRKETENEGAFTPGIYRVNPYFRSSCSISKRAAGDEDGDPDGTHPSYIENAYALGDLPMYSAGTKYGLTIVIAGNWFDLWCYATAVKVKVITDSYKDSLGQLALQKAQGKVGAAELDLGETLGEYKETIQMLRNPLSNLKKFLLDDRTRNLNLLMALYKKDKYQVNRLLGRTGAASADAMSATWMELRYGLRPLIMLLQDIIDRVSDKQKKILDPDRIRSARSKLIYGPYKYKQDLKYVAGYAKVQSAVTVEDLFTATASVQYRQSQTDSFLDTLGLTPKFLPETAFALTRLSFVVGWLFTIGPWLGTLRISPEITILGNTVGVKHVRKVTVEPYTLGSWDDPGVYPGYGKDETVFTDSSYRRRANVILENHPHFTWGRTMDLWKAIDLIALTWQFLPKKLKNWRP